MVLGPGQAIQPRRCCKRAYGMFATLFAGDIEVSPVKRAIVLGPPSLAEERQDECIPKASQHVKYKMQGIF